LHSITFYIFLRKFDVVNTNLSKEKRVSEVKTTDTEIELLICELAKELLIRPVCLKVSLVKGEVVFFFRKIFIPGEDVVFAQTVFNEIFINSLCDSSFKAGTEHVNFVTFTIISNVSGNLIEE